MFHTHSSPCLCHACFLDSGAYYTLGAQHMDNFLLQLCIAMLAWVSLTKTLAVSLLPCSTTMLFFISDCNSPASGLSSLLELIKASLNNVSFCVTTCTQNVLLHFSPSDQNMVYFISKILTDGNNIYPNTSKGWPSLLSLISHS